MFKIIICILISVATTAKAGSVGFDNISEAEFKDLVGEFSSAYVHSSVSPASSLGRLFGFEVGLIAGAAKSKTVERLSKEQDPNSEISALPHASLFGAVTFPFGLTGEINFLPEVESDVTFKTGSLAVKWTLTDIWPLPVELALKLHSSKSTATWNQDVSGTPTNVEYDQKITGLSFLASKKYTIFEPYVSIGSLKSTGTLAVQGAGSIFDPLYTASSSSSAKATGGQFLLGINFNFAVIKLGMEAGKVLDSNKLSLKASMYF